MASKVKTAEAQSRTPTFCIAGQDYVRRPTFSTVAKLESTSGPLPAIHKRGVGLEIGVVELAGMLAATGQRPRLTQMG